MLVNTKRTNKIKNMSETSNIISASKTILLPLAPCPLPLKLSQMFSGKRQVIVVMAVACMLTAAPAAAAGALPDSLQLKARAGYSIGATTPLPLPETIRGIEGYTLTPSLTAGFDAMLPVSRRWGVMTGLRLENKGMRATVTTKAYYMELTKGGQQMAGLFTGRVDQKVRQWMLTVPVQAALALGRRVMLKGGPYVSFLLGKEFSGTASDGYLRKDTPTGAKILMGSEEGEWAVYDLTDDMRSVQLGIGVGVDWQVCGGLGFSADLSWGLTGVFPGGYKTVEQTLYPIYGTIGVFYRLK